jgi:hypothetical protein
VFSLIKDFNKVNHSFHGLSRKILKKFKKKRKQLFSRLRGIAKIGGMKGVLAPK